MPFEWLTKKCCMRVVYEVLEKQGVVNLRGETFTTELACQLCEGECVPSVRSMGELSDADRALIDSGVGVAALEEIRAQRLIEGWNKRELEARKLRLRER